MQQEITAAKTRQEAPYHHADRYRPEEHRLLPNLHRNSRKQSKLEGYRAPHPSQLDKTALGYDHVLSERNQR